MVMYKFITDHRNTWNIYLTLLSLTTRDKYYTVLHNTNVCIIFYFDRTEAYTASWCKNYFHNKILISGNITQCNRNEEGKIKETHVSINCEHEEIGNDIEMYDILRVVYVNALMDISHHEKTFDHVFWKLHYNFVHVQNDLKMIWWCSKVDLM